MLKITIIIIAKTSIIIVIKEDMHPIIYYRVISPNKSFHFTSLPPTCCSCFLPVSVAASPHEWITPPPPAGDPVPALLPVAPEDPLRYAACISLMPVLHNPSLRYTNVHIHKYDRKNRHGADDTGGQGYSFIVETAGYGSLGRGGIGGDCKKKNELIADSI